jgi:hypothetical protein
VAVWVVERASVRGRAWHVSGFERVGPYAHIGLVRACIQSARARQGGGGLAGAEEPLFFLFFSPGRRTP